jgi:hypothetical protein
VQRRLRRALVWSVFRNAGLYSCEYPELQGVFCLNRVCQGCAERPAASPISLSIDLFARLIINRSSSLVMTVASASPEDEIVYLKHQLAVAETRLERAESFVFDLRCLAAKKSGRALWMREGDGSGLRGAHEGSAGLGGWKELNVRINLQFTLLSSTFSIVCSLESSG